MLKILKEKIPEGCILCEKDIYFPLVSPVKSEPVPSVLKYLDGPEGTEDDSYLIIDKKLIDPFILEIIKKLIEKTDRCQKKIRLQDCDGMVFSVNTDKEHGKLVNIELNDDYSIVGEDVAGKLTTFNFEKIKNKNFANFSPKTIEPGEVINVRQVGSGPKVSGGMASYKENKRKTNESIDRWNQANKKTLEEAGVPYMPHVGGGTVDSVIGAVGAVNALTSGISGSISDIGITIDSVTKLMDWWDKRQVNNAYKREEELSKQKIAERNKLSGMFYRSNLKKVEADGFQSLQVLTNIYNMGFSKILVAPHYFKPEFLKILLAICSVCVENALPPNKIIDTKMNLGTLTLLYKKLISKYGAPVKSI